jgi:hypothetical protein
MTRPVPVAFVASPGPPYPTSRRVGALNDTRLRKDASAFQLTKERDGGRRVGLNHAALFL